MPLLFGRVLGADSIEVKEGIAASLTIYYCKPLCSAK
jgi:hypothetical protein